MKYVDPYGLYLNPFNRDTTPDITLSSISNDLSTISNLAVTGGLAAGGPTNPVGAGLLGFGGVAGAASIGAGSISVVNDFINGGYFNETAAAGVVNSGAISEVQRKTLNALPNRFEVPVRTVITTYGVVTGSMFKEASMNASCGAQ
ncbi:hypothetical protein [Vibrio sp. F74]|uniref:hypothetical protein n=1 Tax=Vibrio sp. F74 TaxID=700020 RepID=UPI0035F5DB2B